MDVYNTSITMDNGSSFTIKKRAAARIDPVKCVNCGTCRENCPVEAISEQQRVICRLCPECTDRPALTHRQMTALSTEKACTTACPLGIMPQGYINLVRAGKEDKAYKLIWDKNPLPGVCGRICTHPCEQSCKRGLLVDEPMAIRGIKRYLSDKTDFVPEPYPNIYEEEIAVIGAGPAGLTAAHYLSQYGYQVTVFDEETKAGGMMRRGIPTFRLDRDALDREIAALEKAGIRFELGKKIGPAKMAEIKKEYDAVVIATGAPTAKELKIEGWRAEGVMTALNFMEHVNNNQQIERHPGQVFSIEDPKVVVIGGGAVGIDAARTAMRLGASRVVVACVESGDDVPCHPWELEMAVEEGVEMMEGWAPASYNTAWSKVESVTFKKVTKFEKIDNKISFETDDNDLTTIEADWVIVAVGQAPEKVWAAYEEDDRVFYAGDVRSTAISVVDAMASGKKAAMEVDEKLRNRTSKDSLDLRVLNLAPLEEKIYPTNRLKVNRPEMPILSPEERRDNFEEVETEYTASVIRKEVERCLQCGYQKVDPDKCIGCGVCKVMCPKGDAITLVPVDEGR